jgi:O-6-methylguanine DNA methyltransferase
MIAFVAVIYGDLEAAATHMSRHDLLAKLVPAPVTEALTAYFDGDLRALDAVPTVTGGTDFQRSVWAALRDIPPGETEGYGQLAARIGRPSASRAVGAANGANPVAIIVPCHRVIGASGSLTGFGGGLSRKAWLLEHERRHAGGRLL